MFGHLYVFDLAALKALESPKKFTSIANGMDNGLSLRECQYRFLGSLTQRALFERWKKIAIPWVRPTPMQTLNNVSNGLAQK